MASEVNVMGGFWVGLGLGALTAVGLGAGANAMLAMSLGAGAVVLFCGVLVGFISLLQNKPPSPWAPFPQIRARQAPSWKAGPFIHSVTNKDGVATISLDTMSLTLRAQGGDVLVEVDSPQGKQSYTFPDFKQ